MANYLETINKLYEIERQRSGTRNVNNYKVGAASVVPTSVAKNTEKKNKGGIIGGIGYLAEKAGAGFVSSVEGIWDFAAGGIADLVGAEGWAKRQVENEWFGDWYDTAGDWYNAGDGMKIAGDIAGGIGTSVPALAGAFAGGWSGIFLAAGLTITSAGGSGVREAYDKTGKLSGKEWAYGAMSGATEGALEMATNLLGAGIGGTVAKLGKVGGKAVAKTAAQNVAKQGIVKTAAKTAGKSFAGEAFEEGMSAILNPQYARLTYDPNAESATAQEVAYSAFVGGMAGVVMGGAHSTYTEIKSRATANNLINNKRDGEVFTLAEALISKDDSDPIGTSIMRDVRGAYQELTESLKGTNGEYTTGRQKYLLGRLNYLTTEATLNEATVASAIHALKNADAIAESLNSLGYTDANGNKINFTADQIREGFKTKGIGKRRAVQNALERNPILRMLSVSDAANRLLMDTSAFNEQTLSGRRIQSQKELNDYIEQAPEPVKRELGRALGIEDWSTANYIDVNKSLDSYFGDGDNVHAVEDRVALKKEFEAKRDARPLVIGRASAYAAKKDGIRKYKVNGNEYAVSKNGDRYALYDYKDKVVSNPLSLSELKNALSEYDTKHNNAQETTKDTENAAKEKTASEKEAAKTKREKSPVEKSYEIAKSKVAKYDKLSANDQSMIRKIIRQGIALGVREDVIVYAANIAARTHTDVVFNKDMCAVPTKDGKHIRGYANGAYTASEKRFYFNPEAQTTDGFIIHELDHAIRKRVGTDGGVTTKIFKKAIDAAGKDTYTEITKRYGTKTDVPKGKFIPGKTETTEQKISKTEDEVEAFYAETALKDKDILKHLLAEKPTIKQRILNFFKGALSDYASIPELDADAKKYYKQYRKWFAEFEKDQRGTQINTRSGGDGGGVSYSLCEFSDGQRFVNVEADQHLFEGLSLKEQTDLATRIIKSRFQGKVIGIENKAFVNGVTANEYTHPSKHLDNDIYEAKMRASSELDNLMDAGFGFRNSPDGAYGHVHDKVVGGFDYFDVIFKISNEYFSGVINVENNKRGKRLKDITKIKNITKDMASRYGTNPPYVFLRDASMNSIPQTSTKSNPSDEKSSKKSEKDSEYMAAVNRGDMETAQKMVDEAAKAAMPKSQIKMPDGSLRKVYHGTNSGDFTVFNPDYIGMSSGDRGFFGKGFYFAYSKGEAKYYGAKRIISAYLNITNPFDFQRELQTFNGKRAGSGRAPDAVAFLNFAEKFPEIAEKSFVSVYNGENGKDISLVEFAKAYRDVIENKRFEYQTVENEFGEKETLVLADKTVHPYGDNGVTRNYVDYGFQKRFWGDANELDVAYEYLSTVVYDYIDMYSRTHLILDNNEEFTAKLREMGYDGAIQSADGDEAVAFLPEQIKSADPVTYDDNGNVTPLSKRFDTRNSDIRYSLPDGMNLDESVDTYTEEEYNSFGWARANDILNAGQNRDFREKYSKALTGDSFEKTKSGEFMIPVSDIYDRDMEGVSSVIVYAKGPIEMPEITSVLEIYEYDETTLDKKRREVYAAERRGIQQKTGSVFRRYYPSYRSYQQWLQQRRITQNDGYHNQLGINRGASGRAAQKAKGTVRSPLTPVVNTFTDISGRRRNVLQFGDHYRIEGDMRSAAQPTPEAAIQAENARIIRRYAEKTDRTQTWVKKKLAADSDFLAKELERGVSFSLPDTDGTPILDENGKPIAFENVVENGRTKTRDAIVPEIKPEYKANFKDKVFSATTATQIAFTNAQAGIEKIGKLYGVKDIEALVQAARAANNQAEEMIAGNQYRIGAKELEYQGEGLEKIFRPINDMGSDAKIEFFDYLLHKHNTSRMSLEERFAKDRDKIKKNLKEKNAQLRKASKTISDLNAEIKEIASGEKLADGKRNLAQELDSAKATAKKLRKEIKDLRVELSRVSSIKNKPLFGVDENGTEIVVTAEQSKAIVEMYDRNHPEFKEPAEKLWKFLQNLNQYRVDTGLMSADMRDLLLEWYPYYVPAFRDHSNKGIGALTGKYNIAVNSTIKKAKGGTAPILPIDVMIARQVMETIRAGRINQLAKALYDGAVKSGDTTYIEVVSREKVTADDVADLDHGTLRPKNNEVTFFDQGERVTIRVAKEIFAGFDAFSPSMEVTNPLVNGAKAVNNLFKRLVTSLNPGFLVRNGVRDIQDAGINSKYFKTFGKNWVRAIEQIKNDGELWQKYRAMGGLSSSIFDFEKGYSGRQNRFGLTKAEGKLLNKVFQGIENANSFIEQLPRLAEFISSIEAGNSAEQAILDSADVTTNFARMGTVTKKLNSTLIPFLNPSIQGFSKMIRNVTSVRSARQFVSLLIKAALIGVAPMVINSLMYQDDEDYEDLRTNDKENNFLFKVGDTFIKLPRGRVASVIGGLANRTTMTVKGEDADWRGYLKNVTQQVTPVDSMSRTIFSPFSDVKNNVTWYGSALEGRQFENTAPRDRYDEGTSSIAIAIGRVINYSPKKIHYLLDQYSGVIGDFVLPMTTKKGEKGFIRGNFTLDPATSNKLSTEFYELYDNAQYARTAGDDTAKYQVRYMNKVKAAVSKMHAEKSAIQNDSNLSSAEKLKQTRVVQILINEAYKTAIQDYDLYKKAIEATASIEDEDMRMAEATRLMYGAERALSEYNKAVYEKLSLMNRVGIDYEVLYNYYFATKDIDSDIDAKGEVVSGSKRKKIIAAINAMPITTNQKILLMYAKGYTPKDGDIRGVSASSAKTRLLNTIVGAKGLAKEQKESLAKACGLTVKNGKIIVK